MSWLRRLFGDSKPKPKVTWRGQVSHDVARQFPDKAQQYALRLVLHSLKMLLIQTAGRPEGVTAFTDEHGRLCYVLQQDGVRLTYHILSTAPDTIEIEVLRLGRLTN